MTGPTPPFDPNVPSIARTYDYLLGGKDNYPADQETGEIFIQQFPGAVQIALDNRRCLVRAVDFMARDPGELSAYQRLVVAGLGRSERRRKPALPEMSAARDERCPR